MEPRDFLSVLIFMAGSDGRFSDEEVQHLLSFADRAGLSPREVEQALADAASPAFPTPEPGNPAESDRLLTELLKIMAADGVLHEMEKLLFSNLAVEMGYDHADLKNLIDRTLKRHAS